MGKANSPGGKINRTNYTFGAGKGLMASGGTEAYKTISKGKKFPTKNGGGRSSKKYC